jgi:1-deoxy-D-xylulose-5-phosphate synthase
VGSAVLEFAAQHSYQTPVVVEGVDDAFVPHGKSSTLLQEIGLDSGNVVKKLTLLLNKIKG